MSAFPAIVSGTDFVAVQREEPPQIVRGVLRAGQIAMLSASSKAGKSWALLASAFAVATGGTWFGWEAAQGRVLYINCELTDYDLEVRLKRLADAMGINGIPDGLDVWHLRGLSVSLSNILPDILRRQEDKGHYALILPDPLYRFGQGRDENDNGVQAVTMGELGELAERTSAAVIVAHHFSKGAQAGKEHLDRASGAGMFARAPDTIMTLTAHEEPNCYALETTCRSFAKPDPVVVRWQYPLWELADELDPADLRRQPGRSPRFTVKDVVSLLPAEGLTHGDWRAKAEAELGCKRTTFNTRLAQAKDAGLVVQGFGRYLPAVGQGEE